MRHPLAQATLNKIGPDEPIFVLRAQDILAPLAVEHWADLAEKLLGPTHEKVIAARSIAKDMHAWSSRKEPD